MKKILITFGIVTPVVALAFAAAPAVLLNALYPDIGCERCTALRADFVPSTWGGTNGNAVFHTVTNRAE